MALSPTEKYKKDNEKNKCLQHSFWNHELDSQKNEDLKNKINASDFEIQKYEEINKVMDEIIEKYDIFVQYLQDPNKTPRISNEEFLLIITAVAIGGPVWLGLGIAWYILTGDNQALAFIAVFSLAIFLAGVHLFSQYFKLKTLINTEKTFDSLDCEIFGKLYPKLQELVKADEKITSIISNDDTTNSTVNLHL